MYPKIKSVEVFKDMKLKVTFENGIKKIYDCYTIIQKEPFNRLKDKVLFKNARVDSGGYGISWSDDLDLSESELWTHGKIFRNILTPIRPPVSSKKIAPYQK